VNTEADALMEKINYIKDILDGFVMEQRKIMGYKFIKYVHTKQRYEMEIPTEILNEASRPHDWVITSKKKGVLRFHTPLIEDCLTKLENYEEKFRKILIVFICEYFKKFYERNAYWQQVVSCLAELDCLCGLAKLAKSMKNKCRPEVLVRVDKQIFEVENMIHPCVAQVTPNFVPNDICLKK